MENKAGVLFLGRQAIVNKDAELIGYELLYRKESGTCKISNEQNTTAHVFSIPKERFESANSFKLGS